MQLPVYIATVDHPEAFHEFASTDRAEVNLRLAAWCRAHWHQHYADTVTIPDTDEETIELYFCKASDGLPGESEILHRIETEITLPPSITRDIAIVDHVAATWDSQEPGGCLVRWFKNTTGSFRDAYIAHMESHPAKPERSDAA